MTSKDIREKYLRFFEERGHKRTEPAPLVLENDPTTLFTSAGMQPLIPYLKGEPHPKGKRLVNSQPSFRAQDIDEVGDNRHTTFFEMLGNWSLGDYFKKEQLAWFWEFLTKELVLPKEKLYVTVFQGGNGVDRDTETERVWRELGVPDDHIYSYSFDKNWWSRSGAPEHMPVGEIGGPDSEVFYDFGEEYGFHDKFTDKVGPCHPNCNCGRFLEIGNSVFIQYEKRDDGSLKELPQKNVDFGGGLERLVAAKSNNPDVFKIDLFDSMIQIIESGMGKAYGTDIEWDKAYRIAADHIRASCFIIKSGIVPSNKLHGYALRRLLRRAAVKLTLLKQGGMDVLPLLVDEVVKSYADTGYITKIDGKGIKNKVVEEIGRFKKTLDRGLREVQKIEKVDGKTAFDLYQSYGFPLELTEELFREKGQRIDREQFYSEFEKHKELSRTASAGMFKGGLAGDTPTIRKYHTATHLLHTALRQILGKHVQQVGSNITEERLRFDFQHPKPLTEGEKQQVEDLVNEKIKEDLPVFWKTTTLDEAIKEGALAFFGEKYLDQVKVYTIGLAPFSREVCGGPHVTHTGEIGHVTITKEESAGAGIRRIYMKLESY